MCDSEKLMRAYSQYYSSHHGTDCILMNFWKDIVKEKNQHEMKWMRMKDSEWKKAEKIAGRN